MKKIVPLLLALAFVFGWSVSAQALLLSRLGGDAVYDTDRDITWLADANFAQTSGFDADGAMDWTTANSWASGLSVLGFDDWRLPTALNPDGSGPCTGLNCTDSEMGHLFYNELGGTALSSILSSGDPDLGLFSNIQTSVYWSGTEFAFPVDAWYFQFDFGNQNEHNKSNLGHAWAVRDGDIAPPSPSPSPSPAPVPEPSTLILLGSGLAGLILYGRKKRTQP